MRSEYSLALLITAALVFSHGETKAGDYDWDDIFAPYRQRSDKSTATSGNAQNVNTVTHMIHPWPPFVHNRRIPGNGARMVGAIERYRNPVVVGGPPPEAQGLSTPSGNAGNGDSGNGGSGDGAQPGSGQ